MHILNDGSLGITVRFGTSEFFADAAVSAAPSKGQDRALIADQFVGVADGSSTLTATVSSDSGAFAQRVLEEMARSAPGPPRDLLRAALQNTAAAGDARFIGANSTLAVAYVEGAATHVLVLGDALAVIGTDTGVTVLSDQRIRPYDEPAAVHQANALLRGASADEAWHELQPILIENRRHANTPGGYWVADNTDVAADFALTRTVVSSDIHSVFLCTDGISTLVRPFGVAASEDDLLTLAVDHGVDSLVRSVREYEGRENSLIDYPRIFKHDDAAAIVLRST